MSRSILIVDDNPTNLKLAVKLLLSEGYAVSQAVDAESALDIIQASLPTLVLLDIQLPKMNGLDLARLVKADERTKGVRIVAMTAYAMKGDAEKALAAGCDGYISKPIDTRKFPQQVASYLAENSYSPIQNHHDGSYQRN